MLLLTRLLLSVLLSADLMAAQLWNLNPHDNNTISIIKHRSQELFNTSVLVVGGESHQGALRKLHHVSVWDAVNQTWVPVDFDTELHRVGHVLVVLESGLVFLHGGTCTNGPIDDTPLLFRVNAVGNSMNVSQVQVAMSDLLPGVGRAEHAAAGVANQIFMFGGYFPSPNMTLLAAPNAEMLQVVTVNEPSDGPNAMVSLVSPVTVPDVNGNRPVGRSGHSFNVVESTDSYHLLVMFGGRRYNYAEANAFQAQTEYLADLWLLNVTISETDPTYTWTQVYTGHESGPVIPHARSSHAAFVVGGELFIHGGYYLDGTTHDIILLDDMFKFNPITRDWVAVVPRDGVAPPAMAHHSITHLQSLNQSLATGGFTRHTFGDGTVMSSVFPQQHMFDSLA